MSQESVEGVDDLLTQLHQTINGFSSKYPLKSIIKLNKMLSPKRFRIFGEDIIYEVIFQSNIVPLIIKVLQKTNHKFKSFKIIFSGYRRKRGIVIKMPSDIISMIDEYCCVDEEIQREGRLFLRIVACSSELSHAQYMVDNGALSVLIEGLRENSSIKVKHKSILALGNLAANGFVSRNQVLNYNILNYLPHICKQQFDIDDDDEESQEKCIQFGKDLAWCVLRLCDHGRHNNHQLPRLLDCLSSLLKYHHYLIAYDDQTPNDAESFVCCIVQSLLHLTTPITVYKSVYTMRRMNENEVAIISSLIQLLHSKNIHTLRLTSILLRNMFSKLYQFLSLSTILPQIKDVTMKLHDAYVLGNLYIMISNIAAPSKEDIMPMIMMVKEGIIHNLVNNLSCRSSKPSLTLHPLFTMRQVIKFDLDEQIAKLLDQQGVIEVVCAYLGFQCKQESIDKTQLWATITALRCIEGILQYDDNYNKLDIKFSECGGISFVHGLQCNDNFPSVVHEKCVSIIKDYFDTELYMNHSE